MILLAVLLYFLTLRVYTTLVDHPSNMLFLLILTGRQASVVVQTRHRYRVPNFHTGELPPTVLQPPHPAHPEFKPPPGRHAYTRSKTASLDRHVSTGGKCKVFHIQMVMGPRLLKWITSQVI